MEDQDTTATRKLVNAVIGTRGEVAGHGRGRLAVTAAIAFIVMLLMFYYFKPVMALSNSTSSTMASSTTSLPTTASDEDDNFDVAYVERLCDHRVEFVLSKPPSGKPIGNNYFCCSSLLFCNCANTLCKKHKISCTEITLGKCMLDRCQGFNNGTIETKCGGVPADAASNDTWQGSTWPPLPPATIVPSTLEAKDIELASTQEPNSTLETIFIVLIVLLVICIILCNPCTLPWILTKLGLDDKTEDANARQQKSSQQQQKEKNGSSINAQGSAAMAQKSSNKAIQ